MSGDGRWTDACPSLPGFGQQIACYFDAVTHHVVEYASTLKFALPEPGHMRTAVFFSSASQIGPAAGSRSPGPDQRASALERRGEELVFEVTMQQAALFN